MCDIVDSIKRCKDHAKNKGDFVIDGFLTPSDIVVYAAYLKNNHVAKESVKIPKSNKYLPSYLDTIGFSEIIWNISRHNIRRSQGETYSPLVLLETPESVDNATACINECILNLAKKHQVGAQDLCEIVGELTDNVWSHGCAMGFSMAQKYRDHIQFAVSDCGFGFFRELKRANISNINNHLDALKWCVVPGNSSKKIKQEQEDSFAQRLPCDIIDNPMPGIAIHMSDNNHEGYGLAKLINLLLSYEGKIEIISGDAYLAVTSRGGDEPLKSFQSIHPYSWDGVIINCDIIPCPFGRKNQDSDLCDVLEHLVLNAK